jgi:hypothetical protein
MCTSERKAHRCTAPLGLVDLWRESLNVRPAVQCEAAQSSGQMSMIENSREAPVLQGWPWAACLVVNHSQERGLGRKEFCGDI